MGGILTCCNIQKPGCCCCCQEYGKKSALCNDCLVVANNCPCLTCCRIAVSKKVLMVGRENAGKTSLLYFLMFNEWNDKSNPTKGDISIISSPFRLCVMRLIE